MGAPALLGALGVMATAVQSATFETSDPDARIALRAADRPAGFQGATTDFTLLAWFRLDVAATLPARVLALGDELVVSLDAARGVLVDWGADAGPTTLVLAPPAAEPAVPSERWMLLACAYDATLGTMTAHARIDGEAAPRRVTVGAPRSGAAPWPLTLGAGGGVPAALGRTGFVALRTEALDGTALDALWAPAGHDYAAAARGPVAAWTVVALALGHAVLTDPFRDANPQGIGAALGDAVTDRNLPIYNPAVGSGLWSAGNVDAVEGAWFYRSPFDDPDAFFALRTADAGVPEPPFATRVSPRTRSLARNEASEGLVRVLATANSRAARVNTAFYGGAESWTFGGLWLERKALCAGVAIPAWPGFTLWPGFRSTARIEAPVEMASSSATAYASFGAFGSHGQANPNWPSLQLVGNAAVIRPGGAYVPKARPELGTRFASAQDPLVVRTLALRFPGAGSARHRGEKASAQANLGTPDGDWTVTDLDTTVLAHVLAPAEAGGTTTSAIRIDAFALPVAVGDACFVADGPAEGGISLVSSITITAEGTLLGLERPLPIAPSAGSLLQLGPVDVTWLEHAWSGLAPGDAQTYRGVRVEADDGPVALLASECFNPDADGYVIGAVGRAGWGYALQLQRGLVGAGHLLLRGLAPDVVLQFFAHQSSPVESMVDWTAAIRAEHADAEIWWCGDPDFDVNTTNGEGTDAWHAWCIGNAAIHAVGAVSAHERSTVGTASDRAADGQFGNAAHPSARGCALHMRATLELLAEAALDAPSCPADLDASGTVDFDDVLVILAAWGPCADCAADLDGDGAIGFGDLLFVLGAWGPCG